MDNKTALDCLEDALFKLKVEKPNDRSEKDRHIALLITDVEKIIAMYKSWNSNDA